MEFEMLNFKNFSKTDEVLKISSDKKSIISKESLERILSISSCYAFILAENTKLYSNMISYAKNNSRRCYPIVYSENNIPKTCLLFTKHMSETEESFKEFLNEAYSNYNISICYGSKSEIKMLHENNIQITDTCSITEFISTCLNKNVQFYGVDIPISEDSILKYRKNNLIVFALNEQEYNTSITWKDII